MKHIISIGIDNVSGLSPLSAAVSGAKEFASWGQSQGYTTDVFIDETNSISQSQIFNKINEIVEAKTCEQLIVFFSGHGILKSPSQEIWLLSNAKINPNESINLTGSIDNARTSGIPYIVFISDACRILPSELQFTGNGSVIFPIVEDTDQDCAIDILYATRPGNPALEQNSKSNSKKFGLFTQALLEILGGNYPELIKANPGGDELVAYYNLDDLITNRNYKSLSSGNWEINSINSVSHLKSIVTKKAMDISITLKQMPDLRIQYQNPKPSLAIFDDDNAKNIFLATSNTQKSNNENSINDGLLIQDIINWSIDNKNMNPIQLSEHYDTFSELLMKLKVPSNGELVNGSEMFLEKNAPQTEIVIHNPSEEKEFESGYNSHIPYLDHQFMRGAEAIFNSIGKSAFEIQTGFIIIGKSIKNVLANSPLEIFENDNKTHIKISPDKNSKTALIILTNGYSIPVAIIEGYIGTLIFEKNQLLTINYTPSINNYDKYKIFKRNENRIGFIRSFVASAANEGFDYSQTFKNEFDKNGFIDYSNAGSYLRQEKSIDPSLGLYAVYAYRQEGKLRDIKSVYRFMAQESDNMIFDVAMLSNKLSKELKRLVPFCPMIAIGWAYRHMFDQYINPDVREAANNLVPSLWTTFDKKGTEIIKKFFT